MSTSAQQPNDRLRELRRRARLSQRELARRAGVASNTIVKAERGSLPTPERQRRIANALAWALAIAAVGEAFGRSRAPSELAHELWPEVVDDELELAA